MQIEKENMNEPAEDTRIAISEFRVVVVLLFVILNLAVFFLRAVSVWHYGSLFPTSGGEGLVAFTVWKAVHHDPIYTWPLKYPFSLALYNYLFYSFYGWILRAIGVGGPGILLWGRLITAAFAMIGAGAQWKLVQSHLHLRGLRSALSMVFAVGLWFSASIVRYWAISVRPDIPAIAMVMIALCLIVRRGRFGFAAAGIFFYLAWSFKQSVILTFVALCLFLLFQKRWRDLLPLVAVFSALVAITLLLGSPEYRYNLLVAPRLVTEFSWMWAMRIVPKSFFANAYWILAPLALLFAVGARRVDDTVRLLSTILAVALVGGVLAMTKMGAWDNYLLEAFVAGATVLQIAVFAAPGRLVNAFLLFGCAFPALQVVTHQSGATKTRTFGTVGIATASEYANAAALRDRLAVMKKPMFSWDETFEMPWFSSDNQYPTLVIDRIYHCVMQNKYPNGGVEGMVQRGEIPTVLLPVAIDPHPGCWSANSLQNSLSRSYKKVGEYRYDGGMWSIYSLTGQTPDVRPMTGKSVAIAH